MKKKEEAVVKWVMPNVPDHKALQARSAPLLKQSAEFAITSEEHYEASWALVQRHDDAIRTIEEIFNPFVNGLHKLHRMACRLRDSFLGPLVESQDTLLGRRAEWRKVQEDRKRIADIKAAEALQKQAQKELERAAKQAEKQGDQEQAAAIREQKAAVPLPFMNTAPAVSKQQGSVIRTRWVFTIVDPAAVPRQFCVPDERAIRKVVEALGDQANIPGVEVRQDVKEHSRAVAL